MADPTENKLINEPYERIDRLNYKVTADTHAEGMANLGSMERRHADEGQQTIARQQEELFQDVRSQRDQLFSQFLSLNAATIDLTRNLNANSADVARRTAADAQTLSVKQLDRDVDDNTAAAIGSKVVSDLSPEIGNAVKTAVADAAIGGGAAVGMSALDTQNLDTLAKAMAVMQAAAHAMQEAAVSVQNLSSEKKS